MEFHSDIEDPAHVRVSDLLDDWVEEGDAELVLRAARGSLTGVWDAG